MIEPAFTSWPSPAFTPSRWPTLSRPFLTLPPAFLWAMGYPSFFAARGFFAAAPFVGLASVALAVGRVDAGFAPAFVPALPVALAGLVSALAPALLEAVLAGLSSV